MCFLSCLRFPGHIWEPMMSSVSGVSSVGMWILHICLRLQVFTNTPLPTRWKHSLYYPHTSKLNQQFAGCCCSEQRWPLKTAGSGRSASGWFLKWFFNHMEQNWWLFVILKRCIIPRPLLSNFDSFLNVISVKPAHPAPSTWAIDAM